MKLRSYYKEVKLEAKKIIWPGKTELVGSVILVFIIVGLFSLFFLAIDSILFRLVHFILS